MCNIKNRSIPVVELTQIQKLSDKNLGHWYSQKLTVMPIASVQVAAQAMEVPG
jgi:hypothetical protein